MLSNAVKFTPNGGRVDVRLERLDSDAQITVCDTGKGISADFLPLIFDRFRQADSTSTRKCGGLGLGLAIVRQIIEMHGGTVRAESRGEGTGSNLVHIGPEEVMHMRKFGLFLAGATLAAAVAQSADAAMSSSITSRSSRTTAAMSHSLMGRHGNTPA
jgi:signal transduction histidine kinase